MLNASLLLVLAAGPWFPKVVEKFKPISLPFDAKNVAVPKTGLTNFEIEQLGVAKSTSKELEVLRNWKPEPEEGETNTLWPVGAFKRGEVQVLVVRLDQEMPMGSISDSFALTYDPTGKLLDGFHLASNTSTEAGGYTFTSKLEANFTFTGSGELRVPMMEEGLPGELVVQSTVKGTLLPSGKVQREERFSTKDGAFTDPKSKEELRVFGARVFYRGTDADKPFQELQVEGDTVRFKKGGKPYQLSWSDTRDAVSCKNPDGTVQRFERTW
ncbi:MAG: hypothetical protein U0228_25145 [Myxococcaceae bacterium]